MKLQDCEVMDIIVTEGDITYMVIMLANNVKGVTCYSHATSMIKGDEIVKVYREDRIPGLGYHHCLLTAKNFDKAIQQWECIYTRPIFKEGDTLICIKSYDLGKKGDIITLSKRHDNHSQHGYCITKHVYLYLADDEQQFYKKVESKEMTLSEIIKELGYNIKIVE